MSYGLPLRAFVEAYNFIWKSLLLYVVLLYYFFPSHLFRYGEMGWVSGQSRVSPVTKYSFECILVLLTPISKSPKTCM